MIMKSVMKICTTLAVMAVVFTGCNKDEDLAAPEMGETKIKYITENSATLTAELTDEGDEIVNRNGVCWSTEPEPTIDDNEVKASDYEDIFTAELEDLTAGTTYYARGYATSDAGTSYGQEITFTTTTPVEDIEGNQYPTVQIGDQIWMAENLKTTTYNDGSAIPNETDNDAWSELTTDAYSWWENDTEEANDDWGAYYNYFAVETGKLAPEGWHVATEEDWNELIAFVDEDADKIKHMGSTTFGDNNQTNFNAYMAGYRAGGSGGFARRGEWSFFWIGGENAGGVNYSTRIESDSKGFEHDANSSQTGSSVRCIKD